MIAYFRKRKKEKKLFKEIEVMSEVGELKKYNSKKQMEYINTLINAFDPEYDLSSHPFYQKEDAFKMVIFKLSIENLMNHFVMKHTEDKTFNQKGYRFVRIVWGSSPTEDYLILYSLDSERKKLFKPFFPMGEKDEIPYSLSDFTQGDIFHSDKFILFEKYFNPTEDEFHFFFREALRKNFKSEYDIASFSEKIIKKTEKKRWFSS